MNRYDIILKKEPPPSPELPKEEKIYGESMVSQFFYREHRRQYLEHYFGNWNWPGINPQEK